jgi:hypothetical protein
MVRVMRTRLALITIGFAFLIPAIAQASLAGEQQQGQNLIGQLQSSTKTCGELSAKDLDHIGEYVMFRALGSTTLHQAMNNRMIAMLGEQGETRMHQALGARYAVCTTTGSAAGGYGGMVGGGGMLGGYCNANGGFGAMMSSGDWSWMMGGAWQNMTRHDWQRLQHRLLGTNTTSHHGWSMGAMMAAVLAGLVLVSLAIVGVIRRPFRRPPAASPSQ